MEIDHDLEAAVRVVAALAEGGNLVEEGMDTLLTTTDFADYLDKHDYRPPWADLLMVDAEGQPVADAAGEPVSAKDWIDSLQTYNIGRRTEMSSIHSEISE
ncbi:MAG: hypothetical protein GY926_09975 [bacterium]|nr:hypothetical protein [bacterium]